MIRTWRDTLNQLIPGGTVTGDLIRSIDWSQNPLGTPDQWPEALKLTLATALRSLHPMFIFWGDDLISFYNDSFMPSIQNGKHPQAMGQKGRELWAEIWHLVGDQLEGVLKHGTATWHVDQLVPFYRNGRIEDIYWTYSYSPIMNSDGTIGGILVVCTETTKKVRDERELQAAHRQAELAREELNSFIMEAPVAIATLSGPDHVYTLLNPAIMNLLFGGRPASDLLGKPVKVALPELEGQGFSQILDEVYRTGKPFVGSKIRVSVKQADGREKEMFINFTYQPRRNAENAITGILAVVYEATDQVNEENEIRSLAENLRAAIVVRDAFLGVASHELKTPLTSLKLQNQLNQRTLNRGGLQAFTAESLRFAFTNVEKQIRRLTRLVEDMLDASRISTGKLTIDPIDLDLSSLVRETSLSFSGQLEAAGCKLSLDLEPDLQVRGDPLRLEQVLANLIINVIKYAAEAPVEIGLRNQGGRALLSVRDYGPGIPPKMRERVFNRFERLFPETQVSGLGLGLHISREIVLSHEGQIRVRDTEEPGARFEVELPLLSC